MSINDMLRDRDAWLRRGLPPELCRTFHGVCCDNAMCDLLWIEEQIDRDLSITSDGTVLLRKSDGTDVVLGTVPWASSTAGGR